MDAEQRSGDACSIAMREAIFRAIYIECARLTGAASCGDHPRLVSGALQIISKEYRTALRPRDIAERVGVTAAHLSHELRRRTGRSPSEWIAQARIDAAKLRLLSSRDSVSTIAAAVGYTDVSQLNRQFRQLTSMSPHAWRNANKASHPAN
jgi:AraC-like DNA-binding protein